MRAMTLARRYQTTVGHSEDKYRTLQYLYILAMHSFAIVAMNAGASQHYSTLHVGVMGLVHASSD